MGPPPAAGEEKIGMNMTLLSFLFIFVFQSVIMKSVGGEIGAASALAPKLGPLGLVSASC